jgi:hypothetical protein
MSLLVGINLILGATLLLAAIALSYGCRSLLRYGSDNGFGWQANEVVGASVVSVPLASAAASADSAFRSIMIWIIVVFAAAMLMVNTIVYLLVVRPVRRIATIADQLSVGNVSAGETS